ncbi:MAG: PEP-CTERM sorting domain-containing protein [Rhodanobacter sp.]|nr:MAG: PEP-CTERM sorting domain-containing protein [Rhodanobacter sp.]TAL99567.1 MAG: PEP-CTERM sorting domain-containing protein [Rhodanobacter sp.]TAM43012.1 MAG: PEP-CTERM sorting domain-containing protein [Rhodanobacter sp.]TAN28169.1 MAG: PEP-CTERM sorting domain-containing protein [Rhodanobacter sp.]
MRTCIPRLSTAALTLIAASGIAAGLSLVAQPAEASPVIVNHFGASGWYSSDTRDANGTNLYGQKDTQPYLIAQHGAVAGDDAKIEQQIGFVAGPAGSLDGDGAVQVYATDKNQGKANLSVADTTPSGFGAGTALVGSDFYASFRDYSQPAPTNRTLGLSISLFDGTSSAYTFSYLNPTNLPDTWQTFTANKDSATWRLYGNGSLGTAPGASKKQSLDAWANDATFGDVLSNDYHIYEIGFNLGSYQRNNYTYVDWFQSNLVNGGDMVDFQTAAQAVPEPGILPLFGTGLLAMMGFVLYRRRHDVSPEDGKSDVA